MVYPFPLSSFKIRIEFSMYENLTWDFRIYLTNCPKTEVRIPQYYGNFRHWIGWGRTRLPERLSHDFNVNERGLEVSAARYQLNSVSYTRTRMTTRWTIPKRFQLLTTWKIIKSTPIEANNNQKNTHTFSPPENPIPMPLIKHINIF